MGVFSKCPKELEKGEQESMFHGVLEVHIADGINMGRFNLNINLTIIVNQK